MRFHIHEGNAERVFGWVVPDNPTVIPQVRVHCDGREVATVRCDQHLPALVEWGWHATGMCGFTVDAASVPAFAAAAGTEVYDSDTNVLLYRSRPARAVEAKLLFLEQWRGFTNPLAHRLMPRFHMAYFGAERMSLETLAFVFGAQTVQSSLISGSLFLPTYDDMVVQNGFQVAACIVDPYVTLARALNWLASRAPLLDDPRQAWRVAHLKGPIAFAVAATAGGPAGLRRAVKGLDQATYDLLSDPLTRRLVCRTPDEPVLAAHSRGALEKLAAIDIVGHHSYWDAFVKTVAQKLDVEAQAFDVPADPDEVSALADVLRSTRIATMFVETDIILSSQVEALVARYWSS